MLIFQNAVVEMTTFPVRALKGTQATYLSNAAVLEEPVHHVCVYIYMCIHEL